MWCRFLLVWSVLLPGAALDQRMTDSHVLTGQRYVVESDAESVDSQAMLAHLDRFHAHLTKVFDGIAAPREGLEVVRYCRDRASFLAYGRAHCPGFSEGWYGYQLDATATAPAELVLMHLGNNRSVLQHEAFHRFMAAAYPGIRAWPRWFDEGIGRTRIEVIATKSKSIVIHPVGFLNIEARNGWQNSQASAKELFGIAFVN